ncbi:hypothetical protein BDV95DRAFT_605073 [Massariosphaeria phaeospora]|uniref:Uncharacterized protein n=1 Tax=Massariosphaeria phaeospora TaxID=100035 RepID=A0A7C8MBD9_9PLEO|nr:hypothetical protein BDV95DRAFT_605073 [Massariosphaeria phaeospora]
MDMDSHASPRKRVKLSPSPPPRSTAAFYQVRPANSTTAPPPATAWYQVPPAPSSAAQPTTSAPNESAAARDVDVDTDNTSELLDSSDEPSSESSSEDDDEDEDSDEASDVDTNAANAQNPNDIVNLRANRGKKPKMKLSRRDRDPGLRSFLRSFLPQLKAANAELEVQREAGTLKGREIDAADDEDEQPYIEMNLGLGVLEAQDTTTATHDTDADMNTDRSNDQPADVLANLLNHPQPEAAAGIQEVLTAEQT